MVHLRLSTGTLATSPLDIPLALNLNAISAAPGSVTYNGSETQQLGQRNYTESTQLDDNSLSNHTDNATDRNSATNAAIEELELTWFKLVLAVIFSMLIVITVIGNTLVILSVLTTRRLRTVTNCFVMSLAVADWLVGLFVMPPKVAVYVMGEWSGT